MIENNVELMMEAAKTSNSVYMKYLLEEKKKTNAIFCFMEGEDYKYYRGRLLRYLGVDEEDIIVFDCGGKSEVKKIYDLLKHKQKTKCIFFIDKDFDEPLASKKLFQTDGYSIENYYITVKAFKSLLRGICLLNTAEENYKKSVKNYEKVLKEFNNAITPINAYIKYIRERDKKETRLAIPEHSKIWRFVASSISVDSITIEERSFDFERIKSLFSDDREFNIEEVEKISEEFSKNKNRTLLFRGKNQLHFYQKYLDIMMREIKRNGYFKNYSRKVSINVNTDSLSTLSEYAETSPKLIEFLTEYRKAYLV